jgi:hypothetical protein
MALATTGCMASEGGGGPPVDGEPPGESETTQECGTNGGVLEGSVYYWGLPGDPDSVAADSVDVFLTNGGPTYRTPTSVQGTFSIDIIEGEWLVVADNQTGCLSENTETVVVTRCETTEVTLLIDLCEY